MSPESLTRREPDGVDAVEFSWQPEVMDARYAMAALNRRWTTWRQLLIIPALGLFLILWGWLWTDSIVVTAGVTTLAFVVLFIALPQLNAGRRIWRFSPVLREATTMRLSVTDGVQVSSKTRETTVRWSGMRPVLETDQVFILRMIGQLSTLFILPKRVLHPADIDQVRAVIAAAQRP